MRIRHISVANFRGIRRLSWAVPAKSLVCLIGRGDSGKSTVLEAMRRLFHPQWNLSFDDADFYECNPENPITIEAVLGAIPDEFRDLDHYGQSLSGWNEATRQWLSEPAEDLEDVLRVRLKVGNELEPSWRVVRGDVDEGVAFKVSDRAKVSVSLVGGFSDRHLSWSQGSVLNRLTKTENVGACLADAGRAAKEALELRRAEGLASFDQVAKTAETTARSLGVVVNTAYQAHLDCEAMNVRVGALALHDGDMPLRQLGLGSKRLLTTGLQKHSQVVAHVTLLDEVEIGLEPHRIARLVRHLKDDNTGQYILTTHSPVVLRDLDVEHLHVVHRRSGQTEIVAARQPGIADSIQGSIRKCAEAFLAPKIVVCEGATEVGFLRGLDEYWISLAKPALAYQGVTFFDANGASKIRQVAEDLRRLHYDVGVMADSDAPDQFSDTDGDYLRSLGVTVAKWGGGLSIERRLFSDLPWSEVLTSFELACRLDAEPNRRLDQVATQYGSGFVRDHHRWADTAKIRTALGKAAQASEWFKRQSVAREWALGVCSCLADDDMVNSDLVATLTHLRNWIDRV